MKQTLDSALTEAYTLIEDANPDQAKTLLEPYLSEYPNDPDLWWVYLHALDSPNEAQQALDKVLELDPDYPGAANLATELDIDTHEFPAVESKKSSLKRLRSSQSAPPTLPDDSPGVADPSTDFDNDFDSLEQPDRSRPKLLIIALGAIGILAALVIGFFGFQFFTTNPDEAQPTQADQNVTETMERPALGIADVTDVLTPVTSASTVETSVATDDVDEITDEPTAELDDDATPNSASVTATDAISTEEEIPTNDADVGETTGESETSEPDNDTETPVDEPTATDTPEPTETPTDEPTATATVTASPTPTETPSLGDQVETAFADFDLYSELQSTTVDTDQGETFLVIICLNPGESRNTVLSDAMVALANSEIFYPDEISLAGIDLFDCEAEQRVRAVAAPLLVMSDFAQGDIERDQFQLAWRPVR